MSCGVIWFEPNRQGADGKHHDECHPKLAPAEQPDIHDRIVSGSSHGIKNMHEQAEMVAKMMMVEE